MSQFERSMAQLEIEVIHANSPQAKGRVERLFRTLQDRLVKEMRLAGGQEYRRSKPVLKDIFAEVPQEVQKAGCIQGRFASARTALQGTGQEAYNYIQVLEEDGYRLLRLNEGQGIHSMWHPTELDFAGPWEQFLVAPFFNPGPVAPESIRSMAIVGLAAGTLARQATQVYGPLQIDGYEIDPEIIRVGRDFFEMDLPNLRSIAQDGRLGLETSDQRYDLIAVDAYRPPYIPWHLTTREFFELVRSRLTDDGVVAIIVGRAPNDRRLIDGLVGTLKAVFPSVYVMDLPDTFNSLIYATALPTEITDLHQNYLD